MASLEQVVTQCRAALTKASTTEALLKSVYDDLRDSAALLAIAFEGSCRSDTEELRGILQAAIDDCEHLCTTISSGVECTKSAIRALIGFEADGRPVYKIPPGTTPWTVPNLPFPKRLTTHLFFGELEKDADGRAQFTGYHFHDPSTGNILSNETEPDKFGVWRADVTAVIGGAEYIKANTSLFPADWKPPEVRHAVRSAFENRRRMPLPGFQPSDPTTKWAGTYRGITIMGFATRGTESDDAVFEDVSTAWPVQKKIKKKN
ncbi:EndoU domain-containing protein [Saccharothrix sp. BKS2]|uniref:EndoU domain-containing protein n=1 Tax=Saccharothrix sp. BKS2 TaxID=3064400 RepID=UPI0039EBCDA9